MNPALLYDFFIVLILFLVVLASGLCWFATWEIFDSGSPVAGTFVGFLSAIVTLIALVMWNLVFGWSWPFDFTGMGYPWGKGP